MKRFLILGWLLLGAGCAQGPRARKTAATHPTTMQVTLSERRVNASDSSAPIPALIHVDIYEFEVPIGSISSDADFWSHLDEGRIGAGGSTMERLARNGLRSGVGLKSDWPYFRSVLNRLPDRTKKISITKAAVDSMKIDVDKPALDEDLFVFDGSDRVHGRSYEACRNQMTMSFHSIPADAGAVRFAICPLVTMHRHRMEFTPLNQEYESPFEDVDRFYDLGLTATLGGNEFLVVAPGGGAKCWTSIGGRFLINNSGAERLEQVLVIVPTVMRIDGKPFAYSDLGVR